MDVCVCGIPLRFNYEKKDFHSYLRQLNNERIERTDVTDERMINDSQTTMPSGFGFTI